MPSTNTTLEIDHSSPVPLHEQVTATAPRRSPVVAKARELVAVARRYGVRPDELAELLEQVSWELP